MREKINLFERILGICGSLASILGVSAFSVFAIINSFREQATEIGVKIALSGGAIVAVLIFAPLLAVIIKQFFIVVFNPKAYVKEYEDSEDENSLKFLNRMSNAFVTITFGTIFTVLIGIWIMIWSNDFK